MRWLSLILSTGLLCACMPPAPRCAAQEVVFEDDFDDGLSSYWQVSGLADEDYRLRDGGLELRVQTQDLADGCPMIRLDLPLTAGEDFVASVEVALLDDFTRSGELAGLYLLTDGSLEFGAKKTALEGFLVYSPGNVDFIGRDGEEGDPQKYTLRYTPVNDGQGPLRILVSSGYAYFQVGPSASGEFLNFFHSAIADGTDEQRGLCLVAAGAPADKEHWVRFDNFRVER